VGASTFDDILAQLQRELLKIRETGVELHHLTRAMTDIPSAGYWYVFVFVFVFVFIFIICFMG